MTGDVLVRLVKARGCVDATDPRDAAHEAFHALTAQLEGPWKREAIHKALRRHFRGDHAGLWVNEIEARIVEREVSKRLGYEGYTRYAFEGWIAAAVTEAERTRLPYAPFQTTLGIAARLERKGRHEAGADLVLRWADAQPGAGD